MKTKFKEKHKALAAKVYDTLYELVHKKGKLSSFQNRMVLTVKPDQQFNLDGGRYLVEIADDRLLDNKGYEYNLNVLNLEQLCEIVDSF